MVAPFFTGSYITCEEYRAAPIALNTNNLVAVLGATQTDQDSELAGIIGRASRWIDNVARQPLYATQVANQQEQARIMDGSVVLKGRQDRIKSVDAFAWGARFTSLTTVTPPIPTAQYFIEENRILFSLTNTGITWVGNLSFMTVPSSGFVTVQWSYTAGWVTTRLAANALAAATSITVEQATGIQPGLMMRITSGAQQVNVQVASTYTAGSTTVPLTAPLAVAWSAGSWCGEVPDDAKEAAILATTHYIKERKGAGFTIASKSSASSAAAAREDIGIDLVQAEEIAMRYERRSP